MAGLGMPQSGWGAGQRDAYRRFSEGDFGGAVKKFEEIAQKERNFDNLFSLGVAQYRHQQYKEALESFSAAASMGNPAEKSRALYNKSLAEIKLNAMDDAQKSLQEALSYDLENQAVRENLEWVNQQIKNQLPSDSPQQAEGNDPQPKEQNQGENQAGQSKDSEDRQNSQSGDGHSSQDQEKSAHNSPNGKKAESPQSPKGSMADNHSRNPEESEQQKNSQGQGASSSDEKSGNTPPDNQQAGSAGAQNQASGGNQDGASKNQATGADGKVLDGKKVLSREAVQRLLRSVDDRIGQRVVPIDPRDQPQQQNNTNDW